MKGFLDLQCQAVHAAPHIGSPTASHDRTPEGTGIIAPAPRADAQGPAVETTSDTDTVLAGNFDLDRLCHRQRSILRTGAIPFCTQRHRDREEPPGWSAP